MKISPLILVIFLTLSAVEFSAQGLVSGQLLKSNGKVLPYTEIELVPLGSQDPINDSRLIGISGSSGKFSFSDVPSGKYTLSINFAEKPTELSPYETFFYPNTFNRPEAEIFDIDGKTKIQKLFFKLPPALIKRKVAGKIVFPDGQPVENAYLALRDFKIAQSIFFGQFKSNKLGEFSIMAFEGRKYQVAAILFERFGGTIYDPYEILGAAESDVFTLGAVTLNLKLVVKKRTDYDQIRDKYIGRLVPHYSIIIFDDLQKGE